MFSIYISTFISFLFVFGSQFSTSSFGILLDRIFKNLLLFSSSKSTKFLLSFFFSFSSNFSFSLIYAFFLNSSTKLTYLQIKLSNKIFFQIKFTSKIHCFRLTFAQYSPHFLLKSLQNFEFCQC